MIKKYMPWIIIFLSLLLGTITLATTWITDYSASKWGLISYLPITFWIGLGLIISLVYIGRKSTAILVISTALLVFYLYAIPTLINEQSVEFSLPSYFTYGEGILLAKTGHLITGLDTAIIRYHNWPAFLYFTALLSKITGISNYSIPHYFPILNASLLTLFSFGILRVRFKTRLALIGTMWVLAISFYPLLFFAPQGLGIILTLAIFLLLTRGYFHHSLSPPSLAITILLFLGLTMMHVFTALAIVFAVGIIYILSRLFSQQRRAGFLTVVIVFGIIFAAYMIYATSPIFKLGIQSVYNTIFGQGGNPLSSMLHPPSNASKYLYWTFICSYIIVGLNIIIGGLSILYAMVRGKNTRANYVLWIGWTGGILLAGSFAFESDGWLRAFSLGLIPVSFLCVSFLAKKERVLIAGLAILLILNIPAHYGNVLRIDRTVTNSELAGREFYSEHVPLDSVLFYQGYELSWSSDPVRAKIPVLYLSMVSANPKIPDIMFRPNVSADKVIHQEAEYIIDSTIEREEEKYILGFDFMESLDLNSWTNRVYDNGRLQTYKQ